MIINCLRLTASIQITQTLPVEKFFLYGLDDQSRGMGNLTVCTQRPVHVHGKFGQLSPNATCMCGVHGVLCPNSLCYSSQCHAGGECNGLRKVPCVHCAYTPRFRWWRWLKLVSTCCGHRKRTEIHVPAPVHARWCGLCCTKCVTRCVPAQDVWRRVSLVNNHHGDRN